MLRVDPMQDKSDGFFVALFERSVSAVHDVQKSVQGQDCVDHIHTPLPTHSAELRVVQNDVQNPHIAQPVENPSPMDGLISGVEEELGKGQCENASASKSKVERSRKRRLRAMRNKVRKTADDEIEFGEVLD